MNKKLGFLFLLFFLFACGKTDKNVQPLKLADFYFFTLKEGKEMKITGEEFTQGQVVKVKIFVENFGYKKTDKGYKISVMELLKIIDSEGSIVYSKVEVDQTRVLEELNQYLIFVNTLGFSKRMPAGDYTLVFEIVDRIKKQKLKIKKKIHVKALI